MKICFYCGCCVAERYGRGDHFPIPARCGGTDTVDCCVSCHDMKDRFPLDRWPEEWMAAVIADFPMLSRETKIFLAKVAGIHAEALAGDLSDSNIAGASRAAPARSYAATRRGAP
jgi:hypothetical protein